MGLFDYFSSAGGAGSNIDTPGFDDGSLTISVGQTFSIQQHQASLQVGGINMFTLSGDVLVADINTQTGPTSTDTDVVTAAFVDRDAGGEDRRELDITGVGVGTATVNWTWNGISGTVDVEVVLSP